MTAQTIAPIGRFFGVRAHVDAWRKGRARAALPEEMACEPPEEFIERERAPEVTLRRIGLVVLVLIASYLIWSIFSPLFASMIRGDAADTRPERPTVGSSVGPLDQEWRPPVTAPKVEVAPVVEPAAAPAPVYVPRPPPPPAPLLRGTRSAVVADAGEWLVAEAAWNGATMTDAPLYGSGGVFDDAATSAPPPVPGGGTVPMEAAAGGIFGGDKAEPSGAQEAAYLAPEGSAPTRLRARPSTAGGHLVIGAGRLDECTTSRPIVTTLPGTASCTTPRDILGDSGLVVLIPRGTELYGQYASSVRRGGRRIDLVWSLARTDGVDGIDIPLESRSAGPEGAAGAPARVDTHFGERFAAAMLVSIIDEAIGAAARQGGDSTVSIDGAARSGSRVVEAIIEESIGIDSTGTIPKGTRLMIDFQHDIDFSDVYALEPVAESVR